jgi:hypothetical protein
LGFRNEVMDRKALRNVVADCNKTLGNEATAEVVDQIKHIGFQYDARVFFGQYQTFYGRMTVGTFFRF